MPGSILAPQPTLVMPQSLCLQFSESREYVQLRNQYHDGTPQASQLAQASRRTFKFSRRLTSSVLGQLWTFYQNVGGQLQPFIFYNPYEGSPVGSNYDSTGVNTTGRYVCAFRNNWQQSTGMLRTDASNFELIQLPDMDATYAALHGFGPHGAVTAATLSATTADVTGAGGVIVQAININPLAILSSRYFVNQSTPAVGTGPWTQRTDSGAVPVGALPGLEVAFCFNTQSGSDQLYVYECSVSLTFADSTNGTLLPTSAIAYDGGTTDGLGSVTNPGSAIDGNNTTYATISTSGTGTIDFSQALILSGFTLS